MKSEGRAVAAIFLLAYARVWLNLSRSLALAKRFAGPGGPDRRPAAILLLDKIQLPAAQDKEYA